MKKTKMILRWTTSLVWLSVFFTLGCYETSSEKMFNRAEVFLEQNRIQEAEAEFTKIYTKSPDKGLVLKSTKKLFEISYFKTKNYKKAAIYLDAIIANSDSFAESIDALKKKASIEQKNLLQYESAIKSYSRLLSHSGLAMDEENEFRLNLAKCLFAINKYEQARSELKVLQESHRPPAVQVDAKNLLGSIYQAEGLTEKAVEAYSAALLLATSESDKQDILINIAMCYEQKEQYSKALEALDKAPLVSPLLEDKKKQLERLAKFKDRRLNR